MKAAGLVTLALLVVGAGFRAPVLDPWTRLVFATGTLGVVGFLAMSDRRSPFAARAVDGPAALFATAALVAGATVAIFIPPLAVWARQMLAWKGGHSPAFLLPTLVVAVAGEEIFWRACLQEELSRGRPRMSAALHASAVNALVHATSGSLLLALAALGTSLAWGALYAATRRLAAPFACHLAFDVYALFALPGLISSGAPAP